jgi:nucleoid-associated protein YgaU
METHTVRPGDTFARLARIYFGDVRYVQTLQEANPQVADPNSIAVGTTIYIPELADSIARTPPPQRTSPARSTPSDDQRYTVREGDSLYDIAREKLGAGSRWEEIYKLNRSIIGENPARLKVGQVLTLPAN